MKIRYGSVHFPLGMPVSQCVLMCSLHGVYLPSLASQSNPNKGMDSLKKSRQDNAGYSFHVPICIGVSTNKYSNFRYQDAFPFLPISLWMSSELMMTLKIFRGTFEINIDENRNCIGEMYIQVCGN